VSIFKDQRLYGEAAWTQAGLNDDSDPMNNNAATTYQISIGGTLVASFVAGDTEDWFQLSYSPYQPSHHVRFRLDWNAEKDLDLYIMDSSGSREICGNSGVGETRPIEFECTVQDDYGQPRIRIVDEDARSQGDSSVVSYVFSVWEP
jgi:hypothetical protein